MPLFPHKHTRVYRSRGSSLSTPSLILACAVALPQLATAQYRVLAIADGDGASSQPVPSGIVLVVGEGAAGQDAGGPGQPALTRLAASGARFSDAISSSPCAVESVRALETSRWTRGRDGIGVGGRLIDTFAGSGWAVEELSPGGDPEAFGTALADRVDTYDNAPFFLYVRVPAADSYLERLERVLAERQRTEDTLVAFVGTRRGESEDGHADACGTLSTTALAAPLLLSWPAEWPAGVVVESTVSLIDVLPTLIDAAQIDPVPGAEGQSLAPLLLAPEAPSALGYQRRPVFAYSAGVGDRAAVIDGGWKLIRRQGADGEVTHALYDHVSDRDDVRDVAGRHPDLTQRLIRRLDQWLAEPVSDRAGVRRKPARILPIS